MGNICSSTTNDNKEKEGQNSDPNKRKKVPPQKYDKKIEKVNTPTDTGKKNSLRSKKPVNLNNAKNLNELKNSEDLDDHNPYKETEKKNLEFTKDQKFVSPLKSSLGGGIKENQGSVQKSCDYKNDPNFYQIYTSVEQSKNEEELPLKQQQQPQERQSKFQSMFKNQSNAFPNNTIKEVEDENKDSSEVDNDENKKSDNNNNINNLTYSDTNTNTGMLVGIETEMMKSSAKMSNNPKNKPTPIGVSLKNVDFAKSKKSGINNNNDNINQNGKMFKSAKLENNGMIIFGSNNSKFDKNKNNNPKIKSICLGGQDQIKRINKINIAGSISSNIDNNIKCSRVSKSLNNKSNISTNNFLTLTKLGKSYQSSSSNNNSGVDFKCYKTLIGHRDKIVTIIELSSGKIASGSYDKTIKIWNPNNDRREEEYTINEAETVLCLLEFQPSLLLSGSSDNSIKLWNLNKLSENKKVLEKTENDFTFNGHECWVNCLVKYDDKYFISGANDGKIIIWDFKKREIVRELTGHNDCVLALNLLENQKGVCSGSADGTIKIWNFEGVCLSTLGKETLEQDFWVKCVCQLKNGKIVAGIENASILVWDPDSKKCIKEIKEHTNSVRTICQISDNYFASGSFDMSIKIWDVNTFTCLQTLSGHKDNVIAVIPLKNGGLLSCSNDQTIMIWKKSK